MTSCVAVSDTAVVVSSIGGDRCFAYSLRTGAAKDLTQCLGEAYRNMAANDRDLQKACAAFSADGALFAYNPNRGKLLSVWDTAADWTLVANRTLAKHATRIAFTPRSRVTVVGDKRGDVYAFEELPARVLGHSSMVLDIGFSGDERYIVTGDSDEKVRVSHYPNGKNIVHYLMGHRAYVSGVCVLGGDRLVLSGSGDRTLRLWDYRSGETVGELPVPAPVQSVVRVDADAAAVQLYGSRHLQLVKAVRAADGPGWRIARADAVEFDGDVVSVASAAGRLWVVAADRVHAYAVDTRGDDGLVLKCLDGEFARARGALDDVVRSFVCSERTSLMVFLYKKMVDKQKRIEQCRNSSDGGSSSTGCLIISNSKRLKIATK